MSVQGLATPCCLCMACLIPANAAALAAHAHPLHLDLIVSCYCAFQSCLLPCCLTFKLHSMLPAWHSPQHPFSCYIF